MSNYTSIKLATRPQPGPLTNTIFEVCNQSIPSIGDGQILIKQTHMSLDPAMFGWMNDDPESYIPPVAIGEVMRSSGVGVIEASNHSDFAVGDMVRGMTGWSDTVLKVKQ